MSTATVNQPSVVSEHLFYLADYERNGYNDSDFYAVYWDDQTGSIGQMEFGSTRYAANPDGEAAFRSLRRDLTPEICAKIRAYIERTVRTSLTALETSRIAEPGPTDLGHGASVRFIAKPSGRGKGVKWVIGDTGEVYWHGAFGTFYRKGFNQPNRGNGRLGVRLADGRRVFCPMSAVSLNREIDTAAIDAEAKRSGESMLIGSCVSGWTWATSVNRALKSREF